MTWCFNLGSQITPGGIATPDTAKAINLLLTSGDVMAIYDLKCGEGHVFEVIQSFTALLPNCPTCGASVAKLPARFGIERTERLRV
jgi:putative FmdB family regulatory protein